MACRRPTSARRFSCPTVMPAPPFHGRLLIVARHPGRLAAGAYRRGDGDLPQVRADLDRPLRRRGRGRAADRSSRPHTSPTRTRPRSRSGIVELRSRERRGPDWIGAELGVPARTVSRVLVRRGQPRLAALDPMTGEVIRASKATAVRYERDRPGELVHMDVKKLGRIPDGGGWRAHGRATREPPATASRPRSASTTSTRWSTTTPGWPTPRSCPTRRAPPARRSSPAPPPTSPPTASPGSSG